MRKGTKMKKISIFNNKGGVAKTTSVINIAYSLHKAEKKVLVVDCDSQENCYGFLLSDKSDDPMATNYKNISHTKWQTYCSLSSDELEKFDFVIFDLPPVFNSTVSDVIDTSDVIYVPLMLRQFEISGLKNLTEKCGSKLGGIFVTMFKKKIDEELYAQFKEILGDRLLDTVVPYSDTVILSQREGLPVEAYFEQRGVPKIGSAWNVVRAYTALANEIVGGVG